MLSLVSNFMYAYDFESAGIYYDIKSTNECSVTFRAENVQSYSGRITIPSTVNYNDNEYKVTGIESKAFTGNEGLISVTIPNTVIKYPGSLFMDCVNLESVTLPSNLEKLPTSIFFNCPNLRSVSIPSTVKVIELGAFYKCTSLKEIVLPSGLTAIEGGAFQSCKALRKIILPSSVQSLGENAFMDCTSLESVRLNEGLKAIEYATFYNCSSLKSITLPSTLTDINRGTAGCGVFEGCKNLERFEVANGNDCFSVSNGVLMDFDRTLIHICPEGFSGSFICPNTVTRLAAYAFNNCRKLTGIQLSTKITAIPANAFKSCESLKTIDLHDGITTLNSQAFAFCSSLSDVSIPATVNTINSQAFAFCNNLKAVTCKAKNAPICNADVFDWLTVDDCVLFVPRGSASIYKNSTGWNKFQYISDGTTPVYIGSIEIQNTLNRFLNVGETFQLSYTFKPERATEIAVKWTSINESVATVSEKGLVTGKAPGTAEIRCYPQKGDGDGGKTYIAVYGNPITSLSVSPTTLYLNAGSTGQVDITILPNDASNKSLHITSSDETVAYAKSNVIYALKEGAAIITFETTDGSNLSAQIIVVVSNSSSINDAKQNKDDDSKVRKEIIGNQLFVRKGKLLYNINGLLVLPAH